MNTSIRSWFAATRGPVLGQVLGPVLGLILGLVLMQPAFSALAPQYQNADDLDVMVEYVKQHSAVAAAIKSIDMRGYVIHFGEACTVQFARAASSGNRPGPAARLEFKSANCPVD